MGTKLIRRPQGYVVHPDWVCSLDQLTYSKQAYRRGYGLRKFFDESFSGSLTADYGGNLPIVRYAEVLLSYLEAELEAGTPTSQALLDQTINAVRGRASVNLPKDYRDQCYSIAHDFEKRAPDRAGF